MEHYIQSLGSGGLTVKMPGGCARGYSVFSRWGIPAPPFGTSPPWGVGAALSLYRQSAHIQHRQEICVTACSTVHLARSNYSTPRSSRVPQHGRPPALQQRLMQGSFSGRGMATSSDSVRQRRLSATHLRPSRVLDDGMRGVWGGGARSELGRNPRDLYVGLIAGWTGCYCTWTLPPIRRNVLETRSQ